MQPGDISNVFRIGAKRNDNKPRMLCVKLTKPDVRKRLLTNAKCLRNANREWQKKVFINPDLSKEQRERNQAARQELSRRRQNGETDLVIRNFKVVNRVQTVTDQAGTNLDTANH